MRKLLTAFILTIALVTALPVEAEALGYKFTANDETAENLGLINSDLSKAIIDVENNHIRLPKGGGEGALTFLGESNFDVAVLTKNGVEIISPTGESRLVIDKSEISNPVAIYSGGNYTDIIILEDDPTDESKSQVTHFSSVGEYEYEENPYLTLSGLEKCISVSSRSFDKAVVTDAGEVLYYFWAGEEYVENQLGVTNSLGVSLTDNEYDIIVSDDNGVRRITNMSTVTEILSGEFSDIERGSGNSFAVIQDELIKHYNIVGDSATLNEYLSVTEGLEMPSSIAMRTDSFDKAIIDGNIIKFYFWTDGELTLASEVEIEVLDNLGKYSKKAALVSNGLEVTGTNGNNLLITHARMSCGELESFPDISDDTWVEWYISTDGGITNGSKDKNDVTDMSKWKKVIGLNSWVELDEPAEKVAWMAVLKTNNRDYTPIINEFIEIELRVGIKPPELLVPGIYYTSNPEIWWSFDDDGIGSTQAAFQLVLYKNNDEEVLNTGKILSGQQSYMIRNTNANASIWGEGVDTFQVQVKVWDSMENESDFSPKEQFKVLAFDRPVITKVVSPSMMGREWINRFSQSMELPILKAGTAVTMRIYGIGVDELTEADVYYPGNRSLDRNNNWEIRAGLSPLDLRDRVEYIKEFEVVAGYESSNNKVWEGTFYTSPDTINCPDGTVIAAQFSTDEFSGGNYPLLILDDVYDYTDRETPEHGANWTSWDGYRWWSEGLVIVNDTVFNDWDVTLRYKDKE